MNQNKIRSQQQTPVPSPNNINIYNGDNNNQQQQHYNSKQFSKIRVLGRGSFGTASVNRRQLDHSLVVLKEIDLQQFKNEREKLSAINEARIMSKLNHANIIKYHNAYTTETKLIIEMEYASFGTLANFISFQAQPLEEQEILVIFRQISSGLNYLHSRDIIHLDLKMANIFVTIEGLIKIGDFGIAQYLKNSTPTTNMLSTIQPTTSNAAHHNSPKFSNRSTNNNNNKLNEHNSHLGTLAYSSPERLDGKIDFKSDIWSLGCIIYELVTAKQLFIGESLPELIINITRVQYQPIKRNITPALKELFEQMIEKNPQDRPTAKELNLIVGQLLIRMQSLQLGKQNNANQNNGNKQQLLTPGSKRQHQNHHHHHRFDLSTEFAFQQQQAANANDDLSNQINYPHSFVYQVRLNSKHIHLDRVNLPPTKRIKEISKGKSHYLVLTYDNIVYAWGSKNFGQLGACGLMSSSSSSSSSSSAAVATSVNSTAITAANKLRGTRSARNSINAKDMQQFQKSIPAINSNSNFSSAISTPSSSTQTILAATTPSNSTNSIQMTASQQFAAHHMNKQLVMSLLAESQPTTKPFVINELNHRKIIQVAAGNDFSVFLSKTGIVMTCGDGSAGCLGRGDLKSCFTPCMVESLLNTDVISIACGPQHVIAVCGNGKAFSWGRNRHGRLGVGVSSSNLSSNLLANSDNKFITQPQLVQFPSSDILIKRVFCGDRSTIFLDSENRCWACGENRFNKLGLDSKRRFKRTLIVDKCFVPTEIKSLSKYKIINCSIGKNHSTFITSDGKLIVFGQDIDHTYRLKRNIICGRDSHRQISYELQTLKRRSAAAAGNSINHEITCQVSNKKTNDNDVNSRLAHQQLPTNYKHLTQSMISHNQLSNFKQSVESLSGAERNSLKVNNYPKYNLNKLQRQQIDSYMRKSRSSKKMPFECVISVGCTSRFTLALSNDNRVYFWGSRSYKRDFDDLYALQRLLMEQQQFNNNDLVKIDRRKQQQQLSNKQQSVEPQLVANCSDDCFIRIGATNSSLMSNIQSMGSDQPIIHAQDPRLKAQSLADLWILDYKPTQSSGSSSSSSSRSSSLSSVDQVSPSLANKSHSSSSSSLSGRCETSSALASSCSSFLSSCSQCHHHKLPTSTPTSPADNNSSSMRTHRQARSGQTGNSLIKLKNQKQESREELIAAAADDCFKHDAILEPQPIVSLYVPSMFNHNGSLLHLVDLFCFDEDRFYLILDTTVKLQHNNHHSSSNSNRPTSIGSNMITTATSSAYTTNKNSNTTAANNQLRIRLNSAAGALAKGYNAAQNNSLTTIKNERINEGSEGRIKIIAGNDSQIQVMNTIRDYSMKSFVGAKGEEKQENKTDLLEANVTMADEKESRDRTFNFEKDLVESSLSSSSKQQQQQQQDNSQLECCKNSSSGGGSSCCQDDLNNNSNNSSLNNTTSTLGINNNSSNNNTNNSSSQGGVGGVGGCSVSIDEPRSLSTFVASQIIVGPTMRSHLLNQQEQSLKPLDFESTLRRESEQSMNENGSSSLSVEHHQLKVTDREKFKQKQQARRRHRLSVNKSESTTTTFTCNEEFDETSSMPSWVKNEYIQQQFESSCKLNQEEEEDDDDDQQQQEQQQQQQLQIPTDGVFVVDSSETEDTYMSEVSLTLSEATLASLNHLHHHQQQQEQQVAEEENIEQREFIGEESSSSSSTTDSCDHSLTTLENQQSRQEYNNSNNKCPVSNDLNDCDNNDNYGNEGNLWTSVSLDDANDNLDFDLDVKTKQKKVNDESETLTLREKETLSNQCNNRPTTTTLLKQQHLSKSQPNISSQQFFNSSCEHKNNKTNESSFLLDLNQQHRRASILDRLDHDDVDNLLKCRVYKAAAAEACKDSQHYQSSLLLNSGISSRANSHNHLIQSSPLIELKNRHKGKGSLNQYQQQQSSISTTNCYSSIQQINYQGSSQGFLKDNSSQQLTAIENNNNDYMWSSKLERNDDNDYDYRLLSFYNNNNNNAQTSCNNSAATSDNNLIKQQQQQQQQNQLPSSQQHQQVNRFCRNKNKNFATAISKSVQLHPTNKSSSKTIGSSSSLASLRRSFLGKLFC